MTGFWKDASREALLDMCVDFAAQISGLQRQIEELKLEKRQRLQALGVQFRTIDVETELIYNQPPHPGRCVEGPESHVWKVEIEESKVVLTCDDCQLCDVGMEYWWDYPEFFFMDPMPVRIKFFNDSYVAFLDLPGWCAPIEIEVVVVHRDLVAKLAQAVRCRTEPFAFVGDDVNIYWTITPEKEEAE